MTAAIKSASPLVILMAILRRDIALAWRQGGAGALTLGFFVMALSLFPFGLGSDTALLARTGAALVWVTALFSALLSLDRLFQLDYDDGTLAQIMVSPLSLLLVVFAKAAAHWVAALLPLILITPLTAAMFALPEVNGWALFQSLLIGTPAFSLIGAFAAGLTVAVKRGGALITLIVLPLFVPTLIFGVGMVEAVRVSLINSPAALYLAVTTLVALFISPILTVFALKAAME